MIFKLNAQVFTYFALTSDQPLSKLSSLQQFSILAKNQTVVSGVICPRRTWKFWSLDPVLTISSPFSVADQHA
ncbi:hypothetical protein OUZ56_006263 [Daphnia magna]|uniref:Uncharacterized protein n=1 Tax=Daphnia magna TaxID=35525 RepID=A0ABQ9YV49_9CRUS|nr:hypothetical protein OUZ56_006263 [Daphnia magna]